ncbi:MAG: hypothetical protein QG597_563 [Actinomycetota bacterium]|nr:hypothetical protein [Actinomycetota bacterium]
MTLLKVLAAAVSTVIVFIVATVATVLSVLGSHLFAVAVLAAVAAIVIRRRRRAPRGDALPAAYRPQYVATSIHPGAHFPPAVPASTARALPPRPRR